MGLFILWNILSEPNNTRYRKISNERLSNVLQKKCRRKRADYSIVVQECVAYLYEFGFNEEIDKNWYNYKPVNIIRLWNWYKDLITKRLKYQSQQYPIPKTVLVLQKEKWKQCEAVFDHDTRRIALLDVKSENLTVETLQVGDSNKKEFEFDISIQWNTDLSEAEKMENKWRIVILNNRWKFRVLTTYERECLCKNIYIYMFLFVCAWQINLKLIKIFNNQTIKGFQFFSTNYLPLNPYTTTLEQVFKQLKEQLPIYESIASEVDELIALRCEYTKCVPPIPSNVSTKVLLNDIYKDVRHYPQIEVMWVIQCCFLVPYDRTYSFGNDRFSKTVKKELPSLELTNEKIQFNPFLSESDQNKIEGTYPLMTHISLQFETSNTDTLKDLLHEVIKNGFLRDLINNESKDFDEGKIKEIISFNQTQSRQLILNPEVLTILKRIKHVYHFNFHKRLGYPLDIHKICALLLYCEKSCSYQFKKDQFAFNYNKWIYFDRFLCEAIMTLSKHERREECDAELYYGLNSVKFTNIEQQIKPGYFIGTISTYDDLRIAQSHRGDRGCILEFHPSMRRAFHIFSCDISWLFSNKPQHEILFARTYDFNIHKKSLPESISWNVSIKSETENMQVVLLTWAIYDKFINQTLQISKILNSGIDFNLIYIGLAHIGRDSEKAKELVTKFEQWRTRDNNEKGHKDLMYKFYQYRARNDDVNLFCIFLDNTGELRHLGINSLEFAIYLTIFNGLPFVEKDKTNT
ncbi:hypothetical protein RFI_17055 [Reticulomyxa filosa]|uniref:Uncharacterized protein n=1 Tax=Reticulomyxa filosa TaxID=46433 RepID=X6N1L3_RETFI|nr:hypothetical protein RFI_17055 [Reticulomyxa filosa]|eukprot:ETO20165.1 hypothetical protein RFI_17055 [Reticulomyxa filosa]